MAMIYKENNVFDEALEMIRFVFDTHSDIIVAMSGGKDSTAVFQLALIVAKEKNRLPLKVFWLDQEAEWQSTVDYMNSVMRMPDVKPLWFQISFDFTNSMSNQKNFLRVWDETKESLWIHPKQDIAIKKAENIHQAFASTFLLDLGQKFMKPTKTGRSKKRSPLHMIISCDMLGDMTSHI